MFSTRCNRTYTAQLFLRNLYRTRGRVFRLYQLYPRAVLLEELTGLVDRHIVSAYLADVLDLLAGEGHQVLMDLEAC